MRTTTILLMVMAIACFAGILNPEIGLGATIVTEAQSVADYGWTGTVGSTLQIAGVDFNTRLLGTIWYPEYIHHVGMSGTVLGTIGVPFDDSFGMEIGGGACFRNEYARAEEDDVLSPVFFYAWDFTLDSGHHIKPFANFNLDSERKTFQTGFLVTFGN